MTEFGILRHDWGAANRAEAAKLARGRLIRRQLVFAFDPAKAIPGYMRRGIMGGALCFPAGPAMTMPDGGIEAVDLVFDGAAQTASLDAHFLTLAPFYNGCFAERAA
jgi:hypothetical protein